MLYRLAIGVFYAALFFVLGAWLGPEKSDLARWWQGGASAAQSGWSSAAGWFDKRTARIETGSTGATNAQPGVTLAQQPGAPPFATLEAARAAYAKGDFENAISIYEAIQRAQPGNLDARGEMANVLFAVGRLQEASEIYFTVASQWLAQGERDKARALEPAIRRGSRAHADELNRMLGSK
jgi:tetratricopeptide (TPR) repeat protein